MKYELSDSQKLLQESLREFVATEITPHAGEWDRQHAYPQAAIEKCADLGLMGMLAPKEYGGSGMGALEYAIAIEELSRGCASVGVIVSVQNSLVIDLICKFGSEEQKQRYLPELASGKMIGCFALTEPAAGSDAGSQRTVYADQGDHYLIRGAKNFITNAPQAGLCILFASKDPTLGNKGITAFLVETNQPGFSVGKPERKMGICASGTAAIALDGVRAAKTSILGKEQEGFKIAMHSLDGGRIGIASQAVGIAQAALDASLRYTKERAQFGKPLAAFQGLRWMMVDMSVAVDAARLMTWRAAYLKDTKQRFTFEAAQAKLFASETANRVANKAVQLHGGYGYIKEYPVERHMRDARVTEIYEGTSEIQRLVIAANMLKDPNVVRDL